MNRNTSRFVLILVTALFATAISAGVAPADEWISLFNGKDLTGWMSAGAGEPAAGWVVEDGAIARKEKAGYIWTKDRFSDFTLELEYNTKGNSGIFFRTDDPRQCVQTGIELAVNNPADKPGLHSPGALYDLVAPTKNAAKRDEWNKVVVTAKDNLISVTINDEKVVDIDVNDWTEPNKNPDGGRNKFNTALKDFKRDGHIGLQDHGAWVAFRNIRIKKLD